MDPGAEQPLGTLSATTTPLSNNLDANSTSTLLSLSAEWLRHRLRIVPGVLYQRLLFSDRIGVFLEDCGPGACLGALEDGDSWVGVAYLGFSPSLLNPHSYHVEYHSAEFAGSPSMEE